MCILTARRRRSASCFLSYLTVLGFLFLTVIPTAASAAIVTTDRPEYAPGETARIRGAGFAPAEVVTLQVTHLDGTPASGEGHGPWDVPTNGSGGFLADWTVPYDDNVNEELLISATGQTSGIAASVTILDANTHLTFVSIPTSVPPNSGFSVTARLTQDCGGDPDAPLPGRTILFFITEGNCGVDVGQNPNATAVTNAFGEATAGLTAPAGDFAMRIKFLGEDKPDPCPTPGNSACAPNDPNANKRCVSLSNGNLCQTISAVPCDPLQAICPPPLTVECEAEVPPPSPGSVVCDGGCSPVTTVWVGDGPLTGGPCGGTITRTYRCTDAMGNTADCVQTITVDDNTAPFFAPACFQSNTVACISQVPPPGLGGIGPIDNCDVSLALTHTRTDNGATGCPGDPRVITDIYTATDDCGNAGQCTRTWTIVDDIAPTISCPPGFTVECLADLPPCNPADATAADNCGAVSVTCVDGPLVGGPCGGTVTRTYTATDACGNTATCAQVITIDDTTPPSIACPPDETLPCGGTLPPCDPLAATASDNCGAPVVTCSETPTVDGVIRTFTATDACGNSASCNQVITFTDDTPPQFVDCPPAFAVECLADLPPCPTSMPVFDECEGLIVAPAVCSDGPLVGGECGGTITRTITVTDASGNVATCTQVITVDDNTPPTLTCPPSVTLACGASTDPSQTGTASAGDNCDPNPAVTFTDAMAPGACPQSYTITRTWTAADACGNTASCDQMLTVVDDVAPAIVCPADATVECGQPTDPAATGFATATDACDPAPAVTFTDSETPGACAAEKTITRVWTATDACGNSSSCVQLIEVMDTQPPTLTAGCGPGAQYQCAADVPPLAPGAATDNCDADVTVTSVRSDNGGAGCAGNPLVVTDTYTATDDCGNTMTCTRVHTVIDNTPPVFVNGCGANAAYDCLAAVPPPDLSVLATDNCDGAAVVTVARTSNGGAGCVGNPLVLTDTYTATDACGNTAQCARTHTVIDNTAPVILACPPPVTVDGLENLPPCDGSGVNATDNCGPVTITCTRAGLGGVGCGSLPVVVTYQYTVADGCGNSATCTRLVTVNMPPCNFFVTLGAAGAELSAPLGTQISVPLAIDSLDNEIGAFEMTFNYDAEALTLLGVTRGVGLNGWQHFSYRTAAGASATTRRVSVTGIVQLPGQGAPPTSAYAPLGVIAYLNFAVSADRRLEGRTLSIAPSQQECDDHCLLSRDGMTAYVPADFSGDPCPMSATMVPAVTIAPAHARVAPAPNTRGDINLNGAAYEVGDAVLFVDVLAGVPGALSSDPSVRNRQLDATEVNGDGVRASVADLVYLIRVVTGDASPLPGAKPAAIVADALVRAQSTPEGLRLTLESPVDIGGLLFTFRSRDLTAGTPVVCPEGAALRTCTRVNPDGDLTVLMYGWNRGDRLAAGRHDLLLVPTSGFGTIELIRVEVSDAQGDLLAVRQAGATLPEDYALLQNYPNPFNAGTIIPAVLPQTGAWSVTIYNVAGQTVRRLAGHDGPGAIQVYWDGRDAGGGNVASGVYFYRFEAGGWTATRKMILLK
ncbi:MAG TPA: T9SS type A sorting domain-containing protein [bacterium]|nr:T9SS type A sorting domain-containing protein [bacterium]